MPNIKQRYIKPGRDFNYSEAVKVLASAQIYKDQIVYVTGSDGPFLKAAPADSDDAAKSVGRMMISKQDIAANSYGIVLPWKIVKTLDTNSKAIGQPVFLADAISAAVAGNLTLTAPSGDAKVVVVGRVTVSATVANGGACYVSAAALESVQGARGILTGTNTNVSGRPTESIAWVIGAATDVTLTMNHAVTITNVAVTAGGTTDVNVNIYNGAASAGNKIAVQMATGGTVDIRTNSTGVHVSTGKNAVAAGGTIRCVKGATGDALDTVVLTFIRT